MVKSTRNTTIERSQEKPYNIEWFFEGEDRDIWDWLRYIFNLEYLGFYIRMFVGWVPQQGASRSIGAGDLRWGEVGLAGGGRPQKRPSKSKKQRVVGVLWRCQGLLFRAMTGIHFPVRWGGKLPAHGFPVPEVVEDAWRRAWILGGDGDGVRIELPTLQILRRHHDKFKWFGKNGTDRFLLQIGGKGIWEGWKSARRRN